ncbi:5-formyltetrahydrofolate cyclo-ligase [Alteriqipengyuania lutimaris]|uniref:5-formyltetrahydrofolate cyclo-ligase n=2 Tax=Alteriqipengyuania lutimaris TaxID=1538146 RepID=A0A395LLY0_9SPHN|nr:5-formyltetrahydrofolate cyclo-ligase [Alteriqipengyuania lutimaris]
MRAIRKATVADLPDAVRSLVFSRPPGPVLERIADNAVIGLYRASTNEAPAARYAQFFLEAGHRIALPRLLAEEGAMRFAEHTDPLGESDLVEGPHGIMQPGGGAADLVPDVLFVPLLAFDAAGRRLGQGGGYYDRWMADHREVLRIGLAWDTQAVDEVPSEPHDIPLHLVITPTRVHGGEA